MKWKILFFLILVPFISISQTPSFAGKSAGCIFLQTACKTKTIKILACDSCTVTHFEMFVTLKGETIMMKSVSNRITSKMKQILSVLKTGETIKFDFISYVDQDGIRHKGTPFELTLK